MRKLILFLLRAGILAVRIYILFLGWLVLVSSLIGVSMGYWRSLNGVVMGLIFIFPFRRLKSLTSLKSYFVILALNTVINLPLPKGVGIFLSDLLFLVNIGIVGQYVYCQSDLNKFYPFFRPRIHKKLLILLIFLVVFATSLVSYLYVDVRQNLGNGWWMTVVNTIPRVEPIFTSEGIKSGYIWEGVDNVTKDNSLVVSVKIPTPKDDFVEIYDNDKKIVKIEFDKNGQKQFVVYNLDGSGHVAKMGIKEVRSETGVFSEVSGGPMDEININYDLAVFPQYFYKTEDITGSGLQKNLGLTIIKTIDYPTKRMIPLLPFNRSRQKWKLSVEDNGGETVLIKEVEIWY